MMKRIIPVIASTLLMYAVSAQTAVSEIFDVGSVEIVTGSFDFANIVVRTWDRQEVAISGTCNINLGENDDQFRLEGRTDGKLLRIESSIEGYRELPEMVSFKSGSREITFESKGSWKADMQEVQRQWGDDLEMDYVSRGPLIEVTLTISVPRGIQVSFENKHGNIELDNIDNPVDVYSKHGSITVSCSNDIEHDMHLHSDHDYINLLLNESVQANIDLSSKHGTLYTNFQNELQISSQPSWQDGSYLNAILNQGGRMIRAVAPHDNIYLRKVEG